MSGIAGTPIADVPMAVVDIETTGLHPNGDRIVEIAVVRIRATGSPEVILDTLVNPERRVSATEIHGITDGDVADAPSFQEIAPLVVDSLRGSVFAAYNAYFDARFVGAELTRAGIEQFPPYLCLMYMRPLLGLGSRCSLEDACRDDGIPYDSQHVAADDALASARLWLGYRPVMRDLDLRTFGDLARRKAYKFTRSFQQSPLALELPAPEGCRLKSRWSDRTVGHGTEAKVSTSDGIAEYWEALKSALVDLEISESEADYLDSKRRELGLSEEQVRSLHARVFAGLLADVADDARIEEDEVSRLAAMATALRRVGWAPGDPLT